MDLRLTVYSRRQSHCDNSNLRGVDFVWRNFFGTPDYSWMHKKTVRLSHGQMLTCLWNNYIIIDELLIKKLFCEVTNMANKIEPVERTVMSVSLSVNDKNKLKELATKHEVTSSALLSQWIKEKYQEEIGGGVNK